MKVHPLYKDVRRKRHHFLLLTCYPANPRFTEEIRTEGIYNVPYPKQKQWLTHAKVMERSYFKDETKVQPK